jgi:hypothetical protein
MTKKAPMPSKGQPEWRGLACGQQQPGINMLGNWWSSYFGSDNQSPWQEMPGVVPVGFDVNGRVGLLQPPKTQKE